MRLLTTYILLAVCRTALAQPLPALVREALTNNREILAAQKRYEAARRRPPRRIQRP